MSGEAAAKKCCCEESGFLKRENLKNPTNVSQYLLSLIFPFGTHWRAIESRLAQRFPFHSSSPLRLTPNCSLSVCICACNASPPPSFRVCLSFTLSLCRALKYITVWHVAHKNYEERTKNIGRVGYNAHSLFTFNQHTFSLFARSNKIKPRNCSVSFLFLPLIAGRMKDTSLRLMHTRIPPTLWFQLFKCIVHQQHDK
jgi:hypothetical protein